MNLLYDVYFQKRFKDQQKNLHKKLTKGFRKSIFKRENATYDKSSKEIDIFIHFFCITDFLFSNLNRIMVTYDLNMPLTKSAILHQI